MLPLPQSYLHCSFPTELPPLPHYRPAPPILMLHGISASVQQLWKRRCYIKTSFYSLETKSSKSHAAPTSTQAQATSLSSPFFLIVSQLWGGLCHSLISRCLVGYENQNHSHPNNEKSRCCREHFPVVETAAMPVILITMYRDARSSV